MTTSIIDTFSFIFLLGYNHKSNEWKTHQLFQKVDEQGEDDHASPVIKGVIMT